MPYQRGKPGQKLSAFTWKDPTRAEAIATMQRALAELRVDGIFTTKPIHQEILSHNAFVEGLIDTTFVERVFSGD